MRTIAKIRSLWNVIVNRRRADDALDDEIRAYVDLLAAGYEQSGIPTADARRRALVETGGIEQVKEATRDAWIGSAASNLARELRFTVRGLRNAPLFTSVAVATLAIGIAGATAIFTVIKGSLLQPLPGVDHPSELISIEPTKGDALLYDFSVPDLRDIAAQSRTLSGVAGFDGTSMTLEDRWGPRASVWISYVTGDFFSVLGTVAALGRVIGTADEAQGNAVVVLAHDFWQERYHGDTAVVGSTIEVRGHPVTVIGVAAPRFVGAMLMHPMQMWIPFTGLATLGSPVNVSDRNDRWFRLVARRAPGQTAASVQRELTLVASQLVAAYPDKRNRGIKVFAGAGMTDEERQALARIPRLLSIAVGLLLLIACANVANLSLVRAGGRRRELATRLALGASMRSLVGRLLLEGTVLAVTGGCLGLVFAQLLVRWRVVAVTLAGMPSRVGLDVSLDRRVLLVAFGACAFTALAVSIAPVLQVRRVAPGAVMKDGAGGALRRRSVGQRALVAAQVGASLVLLAAAATIFNTFHRVLNTDFGFDGRGVTYIGAYYRDENLDTAQMSAHRREWRRIAGADPLVDGVAEASITPPASWAGREWLFRAGEEPAPSPRPIENPANGYRSYTDVVSIDFFDVMRIPLVLGRGFLTGDGMGSTPVAVVSRSLAAELWPGESPIGKMLSRAPVKGQAQPQLRVVGVAGDVRFASVFDPSPRVAYMPVSQHPEAGLIFILRGRGDRLVPAATLQRISSAANPRLRMYSNAAGELIGEELSPQRIASAWIGVFGGMALLLAAIGLYGIVAQGVLQRTREMAVRSALGATPRGLLVLVIGEGLRVAAAGAVVGALVGAALWRALQSQFVGITLSDAGASTAAVLILALAMATACYIPARRAARLDVTQALRAD